VGCYEGTRSPITSSLFFGFLKNSPDYRHGDAKQILMKQSAKTRPVSVKYRQLFIG